MRGKTAPRWARHSWLGLAGCSSLCLMILVSGMIIQGAWITSAIEVRANYHAGAAAALYIDNFITPSLPDMGDETPLSPEQELAIDQAMAVAFERMKVISIKIWSRSGRIFYSTEKQMIGQYFPPTPALLKAMSGVVSVEFEDLDHAESILERAKGVPLIEIYAPIRNGENRVVGVAEFYEIADQLNDELTQAKRDTWMVTGLVSTAMIVILSVVVVRGGATISKQRRSLAERVQQLSRLLEQNKDLRDRVARASQLAAEQNEEFLRRLGADLHDGPAQLIGVALLRLDSLARASADTNYGSGPNEDVAAIRGVLTDAMRDVRTLCEGLLMPELESLSLSQTLVAAVRDHERRTSTAVALDAGKVPDSIPHFVKMGMFRFIQEGLNNAFRHAGGQGQRVSAWSEGGVVFVRVEDSGPGMAATRSANERTSLGLAGLWHRIESLGGSIHLTSAMGEGTQLTAAMPIAQE
jgi:signal transduction histidine kinase